MKIAVAMTGASGLPYGIRLVETLIKHGCNVDLFVTKAASLVASKEMNISLSSSDPAKYFESSKGVENLTGIAINDIGGCHASGSSASDAIVVVPCSMNTLARLAHGLGERAHERAVEVMFKENKQVVIVPRETPMSLIDLKNLVAIKEAGAVVIPASPGFWHQPQSIDDMIDFIVQRILMSLSLDITLVQPWQG